LKIIILIFISFLFSVTGLEVATSMNNNPKPIDVKSDITLTLIKKKTKSLSFRSIMKDNGKKQIMWFTSPPADKGIAFLKIEKDGKPDDMRMWLPAFKKIRRISSKKKSDSFMGSDLSYEDLYTRELNDYTFKLLREEEFNDELCFVLESIPNKELKSDYNKHISWISQENLIPHKEESFNNNGLLHKKKSFSYKQIKDFWIAEKIVVINVENNYSTIISMENIEINSNIQDKIFHEKNLKRLPF
jgi:outer membrane lipoprotein-sorting protein